MLAALLKYAIIKYITYRDRTIYLTRHFITVNLNVSRHSWSELKLDPQLMVTFCLYMEFTDPSLTASVTVFLEQDPFISCSVKAYL